MADLMLPALGKLTPELTEFFARIVAEGNYPMVACKICRIHITTYRQWMRRGEDAQDDANPYRQFYLRVKEAEALSEVEAVDKWKKHFNHNYKAARDYLSRRFPDRWGPKYTITMAVEKELQAMIGVLQEQLAPDVFAQVMAALNQAQETVEVAQEGFGLAELPPDVIQEMGL